MKKIFVDRRGRDRRRHPDPCHDLPMDLYHRKRRKTRDRRHPGRSLTEDYYASLQNDSGSAGGDARAAETSQES